jgi:multidrug efflux pump subunit AcrA (membrane-fusion protein)
MGNLGRIIFLLLVVPLLLVCPPGRQCSALVREQVARDALRDTRAEIELADLRSRIEAERGERAAAETRLERSVQDRLGASDRVLASVGSFLSAIQTLFIWVTLVVTALGLVCTIVGAKVLLRRYVAEALDDRVQAQVEQRVRQVVESTIAKWDAKFAAQYDEYCSLSGKKESQ